MTIVDLEVTLGELVTRNPQLAAPLERLNLDYCCGGSQRLVDAVLDQGIELRDVLVTIELAQADSTPPDWSTLGLADLVNHIEETHHTYLDGELPRLDALAEKVADAHGQQHRELHDVLALIRELRTDLEPHLRNEEQVLFPRIRDLATATGMPQLRSGTLRQSIAGMIGEHLEAGELLARLRTTANGYSVPGGACASYHALYRGLAEMDADMHMHVHKENNVLFPAAVEAERVFAVFDGLKGRD